MIISCHPPHPPWSRSRSLRPPLPSPSEDPWARHLTMICHYSGSSHLTPVHILALWHRTLSMHSRHGQSNFISNTCWLLLLVLFIPIYIFTIHVLLFCSLFISSIIIKYTLIQKNSLILIVVPRSSKTQFVPRGLGLTLKSSGPPP